jgi:SAM-dependent methyltransferase
VSRIGTQRRRIETHPLRTRLQGRRLASGLQPEQRAMVDGIDTRISPHDAMYVGDGEHYFSVGLSAIACVQAALAATAAQPPKRILDMPCGHGRVLRFLTHRFPGAELVACDLDGNGVRFCAERFGAEPFESSEDLAAVALPGPFDLIWCGSLLTHLDEHAGDALLDLFRRSLGPDGVAVVTTHGALVAERLRAGETYQLEPPGVQAVLSGYDAGGFGYADYPWSPGYGVSACSRDWIAAAARRARLDVAHHAEHAWDGHQDVVALRPLPAPPASSLRPPAAP